MSLIIQIRLIIFSFLFGMIFGLENDINHKLLNCSNLIIKVVFTAFYILVNSLLYFAIIKKINYATIHYYSFLCIILGVLLENFIVNKYKKWYT